VSTIHEHTKIPDLVSTLFEDISPLGNQFKRSFLPVFKAKSDQTGKYHVLKWIEKPTTDSKQSVTLLNEAKFSFDFKGLPNGARILEDQETILFIRDYLPGVTLDHFWTTVPFKNRLVTIIAICKALQPILVRLAQENIVHCDIKPSNILVLNENGSMTLQLIDFGLAIDTKQLNDRQVLFPLGYAAPELILNRLDLVDERTDIFSIGILIWRLLSGELPLKHSNPSIYTNLQLNHPLPDHSSIPKDWLIFLQKATKKPQFRTAPRYLTNDEIKLELEKAKNERFDDFDELVMEMNNLTSHQSWWKRFV
jgi:serine/threonine protein kinase